jgi:hypothetical protein
VEARIHVPEPPGAVWFAPVAVLARGVDHLPRWQSLTEISDFWRSRCCCWWRGCLHCGATWKGNRWPRSSGVATKHADQARERSVAFLQRGRGANAAKPLGRGRDRYRHLRTAGCREGAVLVPGFSVAPALRRGFFLARLLFAPATGGCQSGSRCGGCCKSRRPRGAFGRSSLSAETGRQNIAMNSAFWEEISSPLAAAAACAISRGGRTRTARAEAAGG